jgi:hypothetical protein
MNITGGRRLVFALGIVCILLTTILLGAFVSYGSLVDSLNSQIEEKNRAIDSMNITLVKQDSQIEQLQEQNEQLQENITELNSLIQELQDHISSDNDTIATLQQLVNSQNEQIIAFNSTVADLQSQVASDNVTIVNLQGQVQTANSKIELLNSTIADLQSQVENLTKIVNGLTPKPQTLVFHVCEKGETYEWGRLPNVTDTYNQIMKLNNYTYEVLLLPEYKGNENWTETLAWLNANFKGIPIMLTVFEGGPYDYPVQKLTTAQISDAMNALNVEGIRIFEVESWYIEHNQTFPIDYVRGLLDFSRSKNLTVFWSEWKVGDETFQKIQNCIVGFEDNVVVSFSTNSGDLEPAEGYVLVDKMFQHWGASVQAWYWETRHRVNYTTVPENPPGDADPMNMPISLLINHALLAKYMGAEIIQFEPYWYLFDNGQASNNMIMLESAMNANLTEPLL